MCGIYGYAGNTGAALSPDVLLSRMGSVIEHRGPDDQGHYIGRDVGLGMRRLSIIDIAGGHQPISNEDETVWVVLNGEIYNFQVLRERLETKGHHFRSRTDTEVIVHLYEEKGLEVFDHLRGMFGIAIWDVKRQRLVLGRDRIGEKPLYIRRQRGGLLFASELKSLLEFPGVPRQLNVAGLHEYLALGYVPAPLTLLEGIEKVLPGHYVILENDGRVKESRYWDVPVGKEEIHSEGEWIERIRGKLLETVKSQLVSDVPLGAFLSGGIDSSAIVAAMASLSNRPVKTYAIGYEGENTYYNELPFAKIVARKFGTEHHEIIVRPEISELLPRLIWHLDEPIADSACLTTYLVSRMARESVTVILSGVGGDELFGGYRRYLGDSVRRWYRFLPRGIRQTVLPALLSRVPQDRHTAWKDYARYAAAFVRTADEAPATRYMSYVTLFSPPAQRNLLSPALVNSEGAPAASPALEEYFARCCESDHLNSIIYADLKTSLPDDLLTLTDRMTMAASIECRAPFVDYELIELASRMPSSLKVRGLTMKYLLKKVVAPWLPREVIDRKKRGFGAPIGSWLRKELQPLIHELLSQQEVERRGLFRWPAIEHIIQSHQQQQADYTDHLFALVSLEMWCRIYLDSNEGQSTTPGFLAGQAITH